MQQQQVPRYHYAPSIAAGNNVMDHVLLNNNGTAAGNP